MLLHEVFSTSLPAWTEPVFIGLARHAWYFVSSRRNLWCGYFFTSVAIHSLTAPGIRKAGFNILTTSRRCCDAVMTLFSVVCPLGYIDIYLQLFTSYNFVFYSSDFEQEQNLSSILDKITLFTQQK